MQIHADKRAAILKFYIRKTADRKHAIFRRIPARLNLEKLFAAFHALQQISGKTGQLFILCLPSREFSLKTTLSVGAILSLLVSFWERKF